MADEASSMRYRTLGRSNLRVSGLCLGAMMFGDQTPRAEAATIVAGARELGVNFIDTADSYSKGGSEGMLGELLRGQRHEWVLATKLGNRMSATEYKRLELARTDLWRRVSGVLAGRDALLCPTMATPPIVASKAERTKPDLPEDGKYHSEDMTGVFNLVAPCPALTVPCGWHVRLRRPGCCWLRSRSHSPTPCVPKSWCWHPTPDRLCRA